MTLNVCFANNLMGYKLISFLNLGDDSKDESKRSFVHLLQEISESKPIMASSNETLMQKYISILTVVALYWYVNAVFLNSCPF